MTRHGRRYWILVTGNRQGFWTYDYDAVREDYEWLVSNGETHPDNIVRRMDFPSKVALEKTLERAYGFCVSVGTLPRQRGEARRRQTLCGRSSVQGDHKTLPPASVQGGSCAVARKNQAVS